jgi:hypothetical protein
MTTGASGFPIFFSCALAKRMLACRCCGVCACDSRVSYNGPVARVWTLNGDGGSRTIVVVLLVSVWSSKKRICVREGEDAINGQEDIGKGRKETGSKVMQGVRFALEMSPHGPRRR